MADCFVDGLIDHIGAFAISMIVGCAICVDTKPGCFLSRINVGTQEQELPVKFFFITKTSYNVV